MSVSLFCFFVDDDLFHLRIGLSSTDFLVFPPTLNPRHLHRHLYLPFLSPFPSLGRVFLVRLRRRRFRLHRRRFRLYRRRLRPVGFCPGVKYSTTTSIKVV